MTDKDDAMTSTRDQIADIAEAAILNAHDMDVTDRDYAQAVADAIVKALPGMVVPLEYVQDYTGLYICQVAGMPIRFDPRANEGTEWMLFNNGIWRCYGSFDAASAAANAHNAARAMILIGIAQEGE